MKKFAICYLLFAICIGDAYAACSSVNLRTCLDSVCGINAGMNPAARCQLCGTAGAGTPGTGLKTLSIGAASRNAISATELKNAPSDPGAKYVWATQQCVQKIDGCTADDVSKTYDSLIEQSCKAAGISADMAALSKSATRTKTLTTCKTDITACVVDDARCGANMLSCESNTNFDRHFSLCATENTGCDEFGGAIKTELLAARDASVKNQDILLAQIVKSYQDSRATRMKTVEDSCKNGAAMTKCVDTVCAANMKNKCAAGFEAEKSMATLLCEFHRTACDRINKVNE